MERKIEEFYLKRLEDETGISGTGVVARGVILPSGAVVMEWQTFHSSICFYKNITDVEEIHGHHGKTLLVMGSPHSDAEKEQENVGQRKSRKSNKKKEE